MVPPDFQELARRLAQARLCLLFTPELCGERPPLEVLEAALPWLDLIQVRVKSPASGSPGPARRSGPTALGPAEARATYDWTVRVLELLSARGSEALCTVDDRVDVARALQASGCAGVHVGQEDCPPALARQVLGEHALVGLSTHSAEEVVEALDEPVDYLGFGPFRPTATKGYERGVGAGATWVAANAAGRPVFPIGGIDLDAVGELADIGRAAVSSAILAAPDPGEAARALRAALDCAP